MVTYVYGCKRLTVCGTDRRKGANGGLFPYVSGEPESKKAASDRELNLSYPRRSADAAEFLFSWRASHGYLASVLIKNNCHLYTLPSTLFFFYPKKLSINGCLALL